MAEISRQLLDFFNHYNKQEAPRGKKEWFPEKRMHDFFNELAKQGSPILKKQAGRAFGEPVLELIDQLYEYDSIQEAVSYLPKVYSRYVRGDRAGIWMTEELSEGYARIRENVIFPCLFTEGLLGGLLGGLGARGAMVRHPLCRQEAQSKEKFCVYELVWMKRNS